jgi:hypothetical protein
VHARVCNKQVSRCVDGKAQRVLKPGRRANAIGIALHTIPRKGGGDAARGHLSNLVGVVDVRVAAAIHGEVALVGRRKRGCSADAVGRADNAAARERGHHLRIAPGIYI